jgi:hypothetical protein
MRAVERGLVRGASFALLAPCSLRPLGHLRCASSALPSASVRMPQVSAAKRRFSELRREARGNGSGASCWRERFRLGSSRRSTLQGCARCRTRREMGGASSRMPQTSAAKRRFCELRRGGRGGGSGASCWRERFRLGSSQPKPWAGRRKHIADGPEGAASRGASKAKVDPRIRAAARCVKWEGHRLACPKLQPRSGASASFAKTRGVMGAGRRAGGSVSGLGQAGG